MQDAGFFFTPNLQLCDFGFYGAGLELASKKVLRRAAEKRAAAKEGPEYGRKKEMDVTGMLPVERPYRGKISISREHIRRKHLVKKRVVFALKGICLIVLLFAALTLAVLAAANFLLVDDVHSYSRVMLQELYADAGNIDTLFLGSSHCYRSVDPAQVDAALGTHSFNAGSSQQLPDGSYYMLKEAAAQNPLKTVYLEMFYTGYNESASANIPLACYLLADHMDWRSPNRYAYLSEMGGLAAYADLLLPARHGIASPSSMPALWKAKLTDGYTPDSYGYVTYPDSGEAYRGRGFVYTTGIPQDGFATLLNVDADAPLSDFGWEYLNKITDFCAENGIRLVLFTAPLPSGYLYNTENYQSYVDALRNFCAAHDGLEYWDFSLYKLQSEINLKIEDFSDAHHLNGAGAEKFTAILCKTIQRRAAGESVDDLFYQTVEEKLTLTPDDSVLMAYYAKLQDE